MFSIENDDDNLPANFKNYADEDVLFRYRVNTLYFDGLIIAVEGLFLIF